MPKTASAEIAVIGIDIGKNSFHVVGHDSRGKARHEHFVSGLPPRAACRAAACA
jgi:hypothetical protein